MDPGMNEEMMKVGEEATSMVVPRSAAWLCAALAPTLRWSTMTMQVNLSSSKGEEDEGEHTLL
jgi:hypothetical protein